MMKKLRRVKKIYDINNIEPVAEDYFLCIGWNRIYKIEGEAVLYFKTKK